MAEKDSTYIKLKLTKEEFRDFLLSKVVKDTNILFDNKISVEELFLIDTDGRKHDILTCDFDFFVKVKWQR